MKFPKIKDRDTFIKIVIAIWIILWINFIIRDLFVRGTFYDYVSLIKRNENERRAYVYGDDFYQFLEFSKRELPSYATYDLISVEDLSLKYRRAVYYLYPLLESRAAEYLLVYNKSEYSNLHYRLFARHDDTGVILRKK